MLTQPSSGKTEKPKIPEIIFNKSHTGGSRSRTADPETALLRYDGSFVGDPSKRNISNLRIVLTLNIMLPQATAIGSGR